jgi:hypothetical protein
MSDCNRRREEGGVIIPIVRIVSATTAVCYAVAENDPRAGVGGCPGFDSGDEIPFLSVSLSFYARFARGRGTVLGTTTRHTRLIHVTTRLHPRRRPTTRMSRDAIPTLPSSKIHRQRQL